MKWRSLFQGHRGAPSAPRRRPLPPPPTLVRGRSLLLRRLDRALEAKPILDALAERYEMMSLDDEGRLFRVIVDDAQNASEAVVRLTVALDEIDQSWERSLAWPLSE